MEKPYINLYKCSDCGYQWVDVWDVSCGDRCPQCSRKMAPVTYKHVTEVFSREELKMISTEQ